ncbi:carotenoid oxygenase family protein [uncultured Pseudoteredinibacter sp.]|uniref:carotenoid oxygenase family protein n=1 Tax=uncultured Pseudoteredinibacter sp. TaxID=1641701 RepID=UPI002633B2D6|nr:carotenoid oxygenase family protein [uncultured Pseudoteredinibacter sp.]
MNSPIDAANLEVAAKCTIIEDKQGNPAPNAPAWTKEIDNPYLHGVYAPICEEVQADTLEVVEGEIPADLYGAYLRNGPNAVYKPRFNYHAFDGDGMLHMINFKDGKASYRNRWIQTDAKIKEAEEGTAVWPGVMGPFDFSLPGFPIKDTSNTDVMYYNGHIMSLWYNAGIPYKLDMDTLDTKGREDLNGGLKRALSAHSKVDLENGELVFFDYSDDYPYYTYGIADKDGNIKHEAGVALPGPRLPHDIGVTPNYVIVHDCPFFHDVDLLEKTNKRVMTFHRDVPTRFGVQPRYGNGDEVKWFECEPCYILHVTNCWEEGDWVIQVGCRSTNPMPKADPTEGELSHMLAYMRLEANLYVWKFNMKTGEVIEHDVDTLNSEFNRSNPLYMGYKTRYSFNQYIMTRKDDGVGTLAFGAMLKYDVENGDLERWDYGEGVFGSEAPFCPAKGATRNDPEDQGYLVTIATDTNDWTSYCLIFDARNVAQGPVCKLKLPQRVPGGFHANWVRGEDLYGE